MFSPNLSLPDGTMNRIPLQNRELSQMAVSWSAAGNLGAAKKESGLSDPIYPEFPHRCCGGKSKLFEAELERRQNSEAEGK